MAAMVQIKNKNGQFLVYDLGGGTFDLALVQSMSGTINVIAHEGINMLGGRDFDRSIVNHYVRPWLINKFNLPENFQKDSKYQKLIGIAKLAAEKAKIELSATESEMLFASDEEVRIKDENGNDIYLEIELQRKDLEDLIREDINKTVELTRKIMKDNGYAHEDIDRIVFIGGPTKMPLIRNILPQELGIPVDLQVDPMTAVARGAAIYAESREWNGTITKRKTSRATDKISADLDIKYDYPSRTSDEKAKIRIKISEKFYNDNLGIQIDALNGWTSGRCAIALNGTIEVLLTEMGDNAFRITLYDKTGKPLNNAVKNFIITRTHATSADIPATQTISVKVRQSAESAQNVLCPIIVKGTSLPAQGEQRFRAMQDLKSGEKDKSLDFELYQDEGAKEPELNLCIGVFRISGDDLEVGMRIRKGDEIVFNWEMSDSGLLRAMLELSSLGQTFYTPKFYIAQAGHQNFDLDQGIKIASTVLESTEKEFKELIDVTGESLTDDILSIKKDIQKQKELLENPIDGDTTRSITEASRYIRQRISKIKHDPYNKEKILTKELDKISQNFDDFAKEHLDEKSIEIFNCNLMHAQKCLFRSMQEDIKDVESNINVMKEIYQKGIWSNPDILQFFFEKAISSSHLYSDKLKYEDLIQRGRDTIEENDIDELRRILFQLNNLRINIDNVNDSLDELATIIRV